MVAEHINQSSLATILFTDNLSSNHPLSHSNFFLYSQKVFLQSKLYSLTMYFSSFQLETNMVSAVTYSQSVLGGSGVWALERS